MYWEQREKLEEAIASVGKARAAHVNIPATRGSTERKANGLIRNSERPSTLSLSTSGGVRCAAANDPSAKAKKGPKLSRVRIEPPA